MIANWVWIAVGIVVGLFVFSVAYQHISNINLLTKERRSVEQFYELANTINTLCLSFEGNKRRYEVELAKTIDGIYAAKQPNSGYSKKELVEKTLLNQTQKGKYLCLKIRGKRERCEELLCNVTMPFLGSLPTKFSLSALIDRILGRGEVYSYKLVLERTISGVKITRE